MLQHTSSNSNIDTVFFIYFPLFGDVIRIVRDPSVRSSFFFLNELELLIDDGVSYKVFLKNFASNFCDEES